MSNYEHLAVWRKAHRLVQVVYEVTSLMPDSERYGLTSQMRRGAVSVPANIAEGSGRGSDRDYARFLSTSIESASELEYPTRLAYDLGLIPVSPAGAVREQAVEVRRMLLGLRDHLRMSS